MAKSNKYYSEKTISDWDELMAQYSKTSPGEWRWVFRGQSNKKWGLKTTLERTLSQIPGYDLNEAQRTESQIVREFIRRAHHYLTQQVPRKNDVIEWLALMQHYGAPTRLLDFTYSFFVGLHFGIQHVEPNNTCVLWAIESAWFRKKYLSFQTRSIQDDWGAGKAPLLVRKVFKKNKAGVMPINSMQLNERQVTQQGILLIQGDVTKSFEENIQSMESSVELRKHVKKLIIKATPKFIEKINTMLISMNISDASLFPGLDGFSRSLQSFAQRKFIDPAMPANTNIFSYIDKLVF